MSKVCVLSVGINKYLYFPERNLNYCVNDAKLVYEKYSQYPCEYKELLLDEKATRANILNKLEDIKDISRDDDYFIFNFAGHGFTIAKAEEEIDSTNTFICTHDFENGRIHTTIRLHELNEAINSIKAKSKFVIFDACHSGGALRRDLSSLNLREIKVDKLIELFAENKGTCIITACNSDEEAVENSELEHGIFTYNLIKCLEKAYNSIDPMIEYNELYVMVSEAVRTSTENSQTPQIRCNDDGFKVLTLPPSDQEAKKIIKLDTTIIPTAEISKASEYYVSEDLERFERIVIQLIQEDRFIEIDKLVKDQILKIYTKLSAPEISLHTNPTDAIPYYESCREHIKPLLTLIRYIIEYYDPKYVMDSLNYIVRFEELTRNKSGYIAIIEIPLIIASEIIFNLMSLAYKSQSYILLKKLLETPMNHGSHITRVIYDWRIWAPDLFEGNVINYMKYLFPKNVEEDLFLSSNFRCFLEVNFLFDCYSTKFEDPNTSYPVYLVYENFDVPERIVSKLLSGESDLINCIKEVFSIDDIDNFLSLVSSRLSEVSEWKSSRFHKNGFYISSILEKIDKRSDMSLSPNLI